MAPLGLAEHNKNKSLKKTMPIQKQVYFILTAVLTGFMLISVVSAYLFFWPALVRQDRENAITNSLRIYNSFRNESVTLKQIVNDTAVWNDSYNFIHDGNEEYIQSNLTAYTFSNFGINDIMFFHNDGRIIWTGSLLPDQVSIEPVKQEIAVVIHRMHAIGMHNESGIINIDNNLFFIELSEVVDSEEKLAPIGVIAMTRRINQSYINNKRKQLHIDFILTDIDLSERQSVWTDDEKIIADSFIVEKQKDDFLVTLAIPLLEYGSIPIIVSTPRLITLEAKKLLLWNGLVILLSSFLLLWSINLVLKKRVTLPLHEISKKVGLVKEQQGVLSLDHKCSLELEQISDAIVLMHTQIMKIATHDPLTGLPNRRLLDERLHHAEERAKRQGNNFIVICIDLDGFKQVNDTYGHDVGDQALQTVSNRLLPITRVTDTVCRSGGDEFIILFDPGYQEHSDIEAICARLIEEIEAPIITNEAHCAISASIGVAIYPDSTINIKDLLKLADQALYEAKASGKATYRFALPG